MLATASAQVCVPLGHSSLYLLVFHCFSFSVLMAPLSLPGEPGLAGFSDANMMEAVATTGAIRLPKLQ